MRVHLIKEQTIQDYIAGHASGKSPFENWLAIVKYADWDMPKDIQQTFGSADLIGKGSDRVVFNIGGNNYRMICKYHFGLTYIHLFVCWIGTHSEYDELCNGGEQYTVNAY
jgi:mRNA interferase HigB